MRVNIIFGDIQLLVALFFFDAITATAWFLSDVALLVVPLVVIGLGLLLIRDVYRRVAAVRLLCSGTVAYATLRGDVVISPVNTPAIHELQFTFDHRGQTFDAVAQTAKVWALVDDPREQIVFRPGQVPHVIFVDALPGRPRIREDNSIDSRNHVLGGVTAAVLLVAAVAINVVGAFLWLR